MDYKYPCIFFRGLLWWWAIGTLLLTLFSPTSLTAVVVAQAGSVGRIATVVFGAAVLSMTLNILVNDVLPRGIRLGIVRRCQWLAELGVAGVYLLFAALAVRPGAPGGTAVLVLMYVGVGLFGLASAAYSVYGQYKDAVQTDSD